MVSLPTTDHLLNLCTIFCKATGRSEYTVSRWAIKNPYLVSRLRVGSGVTVKTYCLVLRWFSDNWPDGLAWPDDIQRPEPTRQQETAA